MGTVKYRILVPQQQQALYIRLYTAGIVQQVKIKNHVNKRKIRWK